MHIGDFYDLCLQEWHDTVERGVKLGLDYIETDPPDDPDVDPPEWGADYAVESIFDCVCLQDAVAYIVGSGMTFACLDDTWDALKADSPRGLMWREIRDGIVDTL